MTQFDAFPEARVDKDALPNDRYTLPHTLAWCEQKAGVAHRSWELDVAACREAHVAPRYYTVRDDGLQKPWDARRIWCNPPYGTRQERDVLLRWVQKAWDEMHSPRRDPAGDLQGTILAMLLPGDRPEQPWWQREVEPYRDRPRELGAARATLTSYYPPGRQAFGHPGNPLGVGVDPAPFPLVLLVWRR